MNNNKLKIVLTGGGTAGHIMPNIALLPLLKKEFSSISYIGTNGMERDITKKNNLPFYEISATKFVRKISLSNLMIPFKLCKSVQMCKNILNEIKPDVVFSKGGFVSVPVCIAAKKLKIPVVSHESDISMGLANKIITRYANYVCTSFSGTIKNKKCIYTGSPIRDTIFNGIKDNVIKKFDYDSKKPTLLFMGGSLGALKINEFVYKNIDKLTFNYNVLHITGKNAQVMIHSNYYQVEFTDKIEDFFALCDICISRSGANTIFELLALKKPMILIPLPKGYSRGDQVENAKYFENHSYACVVEQNNLSLNNLTAKIEFCLKHKTQILNSQSKANINNANKKIVDIILSTIK